MKGALTDGGDLSYPEGEEKLIIKKVSHDLFYRPQPTTPMR